MGSGAQAVFVTDPRPHNDSRYAIDSTALRNLGWTETEDFDARLVDTVNWYIDNKDWFNKD